MNKEILGNLFEVHLFIYFFKWKNSLGNNNNTQGSIQNSGKSSDKISVTVLLRVLH